MYTGRKVSVVRDQDTLIFALDTQFTSTIYCLVYKSVRRLVRHMWSPSTIRGSALDLRDYHRQVLLTSFN